MKVCRLCKKVKPLDEYYEAASTKDKLTAECRSCRIKLHKKWRRENPEKHHDVLKRWQKSHIIHRKKYNKEWHLKNRSKKKEYNKQHQLKNYNLTLDEYRQMVKTHNGCCWICGRHYTKLTRELDVDHDHNCCSGPRSCGKCVRGLLCCDCNRGLGSFKESLELIQKAVLYLQTTSRRNKQ